MRKYRDLRSWYLITVSLAGLLILILMVFWTPHLVNYSFQRTLILATFILICLSGMVATVYPSHCSELFILGKKLQDVDDERETSDNSEDRKEILSNSEDRKEILSNSENTKKSPYKSKENIKFEGHHPDCGEFNSHTFKLGERRYCAGCSGLFLGALLAVMGTVIYYFYGNISDYLGLIFFWTGSLAVFLALFQNIFLDLNKNVFRFLSNLALVVGSFLILVGIDTVNSSLSVEVYFLVLTFFWILTRTALSQENHAKICMGCSWKTSCSQGKAF